MRKKISRRRFLVLSGKALLGGILFLALPVKFWVKDSIKKFSLKFKFFKRAHLYEKHDLAG